MANDQSIQMVTLGRLFHLGMLYDIRSDKIITDVTLWDQQKLTNHTSTYKKPYTNYEIITEDSLQTKARALGVEASLKLSLLADMINISGSGKYAEDYQTTNDETRLTLKYSTTTHVEQLSIAHIGNGNLNHTDLQEKNVATHVVTSVLYGAEAFFVFDLTLSNDESKEEIRDLLEAIFKDEDEVKLNLTDREKNLVDKLHCTFYSDFNLNENPNTFAEAVRIYRQLPSLLGENNENAIPKKVSLYPLHLLDNKSMPIVREISSNLTDYSISVIENLYSLQVRALDLSKNSMFTYFNHMKKNLFDFIERLSEVQRELKESIALYLPKLRENTDIEESVLFNLFKQVDLSPFNRQKLELWIQEKETEIELINKWINNLTNDTSLNIMNKLLPSFEVIGDIGYDYIVCLSFRFVEENDPQLTDMYNYQCDKSNFNSSNSFQDRTKWFEDHLLIAEIRKNVQQFIDFAKANNVTNGRIKFIINEEYSVDHVKNVKLFLYDGQSKREDFIIPSKPDAPYAKNVIDNNITLEWTDAAHGSEKVEKYKVMYRKYNGENENENEENWTEVYTKSNQKELIISNLPSNTTFIFKVQSITAIGLSPISDISESIEASTKIESIDTSTKIESIDTSTTKEPIETSTKIEPIDTPTTKEPIETSTKIESIDTSTTKELIETSTEIESVDTSTMKELIETSIKIEPIETSTTKELIETSTKIESIDTFTTKELIETSTEIESIDTSTMKEPENRGKIVPSSININTTWKQNGITITGGNGTGSQLNQLSYPVGIYVDDKNQTIYIADQSNHRVVEWKSNANNGQIVAGGNGQGNKTNQLNWPTDVIVDEKNNSFIICDRGNRRVVRWPRQNAANGETIISDIHCYGLTMDNNGNLYVSDTEKSELRRWEIGDKNGIIVAGGNERGNNLNQFYLPTYLFVDENHSVYVSDENNHRVMKWMKGAKEGIIVAGGHGKENSLKQLTYPQGLFVDQWENVYVADFENDRIMCWSKGSEEGSIVIGGNSRGNQLNQLNRPTGLSFDQQGNLYVVDWGNHRVQKFLID